MNTDPVTVNRIQWLRLFPFLNLINAVRMAFRVRILLPAALAMVCAAYGPELATEPQSGDNANPVSLSQSANAERSRDLAGMVAIGGFEGVMTAIVPRQFSQMVRASGRLIYSGSWNALLVLVWNMLVVGFFGLTIARCTALEFCRQTRISSIVASRFAIQRMGPVLLSTGLVIGIVGLCLVPLVVTAEVSKLSYETGQLVSAIWGVMYLLSLAVVLAAGVLGIGWTMSVGAIGTDDCDGADALSRGVNYFLSHKLVTYCYLHVVILAANLAKSIGWVLLLASSSLLNSRMPHLAGKLRTPATQETSLGEALQHRTHDVLQHLPDCLQLAAFLSGLTLMYVLLRQKEDAVNIAEIDGSAVKSFIAQ